MERLRTLLTRLDGRGYKAYQELRGSYQGEWYHLHIDHVQGDPFAAPSRIRVILPRDCRHIADEWLDSKWRRIAVEDYLARQVAAAIRQTGSRKQGSGKSGLIAIDAPGQEILPRTAVKVTNEAIEIRLSVGLPATGRTILGQDAARLLGATVPAVVKQGVVQMDQQGLRRHLKLADQQQAIRRFLDEHGYVAFIANGAVLPRESGTSNRPLRQGRVIPFQSPPSLEIAIPVPHQQEPIRGMAIPAGVTLIAGGGYHGKSTLLHAIERGVYNHIAGDGREFVITDETAVKIRAEDGRSVEGVNISPFIQNLPFGRTTERFSTRDASGSTSQAANIMEALEMGTKLLLIDEDTSANNFMVRDAKMQQLVHKEKEPITPFIDKVRQLYDSYGVSTVLVLGGSGDYFRVADRVIMMDEYRALDVTARAKTIAGEHDDRQCEGGTSGFGPVTHRVPLPDSFDMRRGNRGKVEAKGMATVLFGDERIDLSAVEQLVDESQCRAIADMLMQIAARVDGTKTLAELMEELYEMMEEHGVEAISRHVGKHPGDLALPRRFEVAAAVNRLRSLRIKA
ncbi:MAG: ABC-ATPase domain-containing protein [Brevibacillus sp.]|nr:ABC-ATPase domain-containing protein [Brevibacillus sp.]